MPSVTLSTGLKGLGLRLFHDKYIFFVPTRIHPSTKLQTVLIFISNIVDTSIKQQLINIDFFYDIDLYII